MIAQLSVKGFFYLCLQGTLIERGSLKSTIDRHIINHLTTFFSKGKLRFPKSLLNADKSWVFQFTLINRLNQLIKILLKKFSIALSGILFQILSFSTKEQTNTVLYMLFLFDPHLRQNPFKFPLDSGFLLVR
jgi:hypothetical protein